MVLDLTTGRALIFEGLGVFSSMLDGDEQLRPAANLEVPESQFQANQSQIETRQQNKKVTL